MKKIKVSSKIKSKLTSTDGKSKNLDLKKVKILPKIKSESFGTDGSKSKNLDLKKVKILPRIKGKPLTSNAKSKKSLEKKLMKSRISGFPIVGIGASAGGLEAIEQFLEGIPNNSGMAFVIIQHLDPTHKGMMTELLQRNTTMKVVEVFDRLKVKPNHIYVVHWVSRLLRKRADSFWFRTPLRLNSMLCPAML